jgi:hypothetical protein
MLLSVGALAATMRLAGLPQAGAPHGSRWQVLAVVAALWGFAETVRCLDRKWSLYHAGVLILLYSDLMILAMAVFLWLFL